MYMHVIFLGKPTVRESLGKPYRFRLFTQERTFFFQRNIVGPFDKDLLWCVGYCTCSLCCDWLRKLLSGFCLIFFFLAAALRAYREQSV